MPEMNESDPTWLMKNSDFSIFRIDTDESPKTTFSEQISLSGLTELEVKYNTVLPYARCVLIEMEFLVLRAWLSMFEGGK